jgi:hypothetical protein
MLDTVIQLYNKKCWNPRVSVKLDRVYAIICPFRSTVRKANNKQKIKKGYKMVTEHLHIFYMVCALAKVESKNSGTKCWMK